MAHAQLPPAIGPGSASFGDRDDHRPSVGIASRVHSPLRKRRQPQEPNSFQQR